jgi:cytochrome b561
MTHVRGQARRRTATAAGVGVGSTAFLLTLLDYSTGLGRTANSLGYASNFFDFQGRALLDGHLYVPRGSLGIEGFIERGHEYMYFGPFPALLRMPLLSTTIEYDGKLTVLSMAIGFAVFAVMAVRLTWSVRDALRPADPVEQTTWFEAMAMGVFLAAVTGGTTLTYEAALPWVYHEVYVWAVALAVGSLYWMVRVLQDPTQSAIGWLAFFNLALVLTRTTGGFATSVVTVGAGLWLWTGRLGRGGRRTGLGMVAAGAIPLVVGMALNWAKFRHPYLFPLADQTFTGLNEHRRDALAANGGTITGPAYFPSAFMAYFRLDGIRLVEHFPWLTLPASPARAYGGAELDQTYRTGSVSAFMPYLLLMTIVSVPVLFRRGLTSGQRLLRAPLVAGVLITGGVMGYGYIAMRYTAEFVPALIFGGAVGHVAVVRVLERRGRVLRSGYLVATALVTSFSVAAFMITGYSAIATTTRGPTLDHYLALQSRFSPADQARLTTVSSRDPDADEGHTDELWITGDCDKLWLHTGDLYQPWLLVERRGLLATLAIDEDYLIGRTKLFRTTTARNQTVWIQTNSGDQARVYLRNGRGTYFGPWFDILQPRLVRVGVRDVPEYEHAEVSSNPGGFVGYVRTDQPNAEFTPLPVEILTVPHNAKVLEARGYEIGYQPGIRPPICSRLMAEVRGRA